MQPFAITPLDRGDLDMPANMRALAEISFSGAISTEFDACPDPKLEAASSLAFLKQAAPA